MLLATPVATPQLLTRREREVAALVAQGLTNREIAARLFISERTAESHVEQIRGKLGFRSRSQIAAWLATQSPAENSGHIVQSPVQAATMPARTKTKRRTTWYVAAGLVALLAVLITAAGVAYFRHPTTVAGPNLVTVAGTGARAFSRDGGLAVDSPLVRPIALAIGPQGQLYIAEGNRVREVGADGRIKTMAGTGDAGYGGDGGQATAALLNTPQGLTVDSLGRIYIADTLNNRVRRVDPDGTIQTVAGTGEAGSGGDGQMAVRARLNLPTGLAIGFGDSLFIADTGNNVIRQIRPDGTIHTVAGTGDADYRGEGGSAANADFHEPGGLAFDDEGNLYIADALNQRVRRIDVNGDIATVAGTGIAAFAGDGGQGVNAELDLAANPLEGMGQPLAVGPTGDVYIADSLNHRLRKLDVHGVITTIARLKTPMGVVVDVHGTVFVADADDNRVLRIGR